MRSSAARGIGFATAKALLARGARVVIGDRDVAFGESAVADLTTLDSVFLNFNRDKRQGYEQRPQSAQGVVEGPT